MFYYIVFSWRLVCPNLTEDIKKQNDINKKCSNDFNICAYKLQLQKVVYIQKHIVRSLWI